MAFDPITAVADLAGKVLDRVLPDKAANDAAKARLAEMVTKGEIDEVTGQLQIDIEEAKSSSTFVAGARPFIMWICGFGLATNFVVRPFFIWCSNLIGHPTDFPSLDMSTLMPLVTGMVGMGAVHVYETTTNRKTDAANGK